MTALTELVGRTGTPYRFVVEEGKVAEFARAVQATDLLFRDVAAAKEQGLGGILTTPTFGVASAHWSVPGAMPDLQLDLRRVLAGGGEWEYFAPIVAGDELVATTKVAAVSSKVSGRGPMTVIELMTEFTRDGAVVQTYTTTILQFDAPKQEDAG